MPTRVTTALFLFAAMIASVPGAGLGETKRLVPGTINRTVLPNTVVYAGTTLECGDKSYHVTTGTKAGKCENVYTPNGLTKVGVVCKDDKGNYSGAGCGEGCYSSTGAGDCTKQ